MDWISAHLLQIIIAVAAAIAAYLNNSQKEKNGEPADFDGDGIPDNRPGQFDSQRMDMDEAERTRRVQDEIRRKIAERQAGRTPVEPPPLVAPRPVAPPPLPDLMRKRAEERAAVEQARRKAAAAQAAQAERDEEAAEQQRAMQEQLRALEARRAEAKRQAAEVAAVTSMAEAFRNGPERGGKAVEVLADLRAPGGARRAWILREVLGTPAGLK